VTNGRTVALKLVDAADCDRLSRRVRCNYDGPREDHGNGDRCLLGRRVPPAWCTLP
jgi:hypothetical protein